MISRLYRLWPISRLSRKAARCAIGRHYGVPFASELTDRELQGMELLEADGVVRRDESGLDLHWHLRREFANDAA